MLASSCIVYRKPQKPQGGKIQDTRHQLQQQHRNEAWGTWEELLLACTVKCHDFKDYNAIAMEVQSCTTASSPSRATASRNVTISAVVVVLNLFLYFFCFFISVKVVAVGGEEVFWRRKQRRKTERTTRNQIWRFLTKIRQNRQRTWRGWIGEFRTRGDNHKQHKQDVDNHGQRIRLREPVG